METTGAYGGLILVIIHGMLKGGWGSAEKRPHSTCSAEVSITSLEPLEENFGLCKRIYEA